MKIEEAMVYLLATSQHGMKTEQIARELELRGLVPRRPGRPPLDGKVIAAIVFKHPEVFCFNEGRVRLLMQATIAVLFRLKCVCSAMFTLSLPLSFSQRCP